MRPDFDELESQLFARILERKPILGLRVLWIATLLILLAQGGARGGDLFLMGLFQGLFSILLFLPDFLKRPYTFRLTIAVGDVGFLLWAAAVTPAFRNIPGAAFLAAFGLACYFAPGIRTLTALVGGSAFAILGAGLVAGTLPPWTWGTVSVLVIWCLASGAYLGWLGIPCRPHIQEGESLRRIVAKTRQLAIARAAIGTCTTLPSVLDACRVHLAHGFPGARIELFRLQGDHLEPIPPTVMPSAQDLSMGLVGRFRDILEAGEPTCLLRPMAHHLPAAGSSMEPVPMSESLMPVWSGAEGGTAYCARIVREGPPLREEEREYLSVLGRETALVMERIHMRETMAAERKVLAGETREAQDGLREARETAALLGALHGSEDLGGLLDALDGALRSLLGHDVLILMQAWPQVERLKIREARSARSLPFRVGQEFPLPSSLCGNTLGRNKLVLLNTFQAPSGDAPLAPDTQLFLQTEIRSLFLIPAVSKNPGDPGLVLVVGSRETEHFGPATIRLLSQAQDAIAHALLRAVREWEQRARIREASILGRFAHCVASPEDQKREALQDTFERSFGLERCRIVPPSDVHTLTEPEDTFLRSVLQSGKSQEEWVTRDSLMPLEADSEKALLLVVPLMHESLLVGAVEAEWPVGVLPSDEDRALWNQVLPLAATAMGSFMPAASAQPASPVKDAEGRTAPLSRDALLRGAAPTLTEAGSFSLILLGLDGPLHLGGEPGKVPPEKLLQALEQILLTHSRSEETAVRLSADSLGLIVPGGRLESSLLRTRQILEDLDRKSAAGDETPGVAAAVASFPRHGASLPEVLNRAEQALKAARSGGARLCYPDAELLPGAPRELNVEALYQGVQAGRSRGSSETATLLVRLISRMESANYPAALLGEVLHRLVLRLDYPEGAEENAGLVPELARLTAEELGIPEGQVRALELAARVYDVGKFLLSPDLLDAPRSLTPEERELVTQHVSAGVQQILQPHKAFAGVLPTVRFHHERWNGRGYPWRLQGDDIPVDAQVLGLVDCFKALSTDRPYRPRRSLAEAAEQIYGMAGDQFNPRLVEAFRNVLRSLRIE